MSEAINRSLEALKPNLSPEESCLSALIDLNEFQEVERGMAVSDFYAAFTGETAPDELRTRISTRPVEQNPQDPPHFLPQRSYVDGYDIAATVVVDFDACEAGVRQMLNLDFVKTDRGLQLMRRQRFDDAGRSVMRYTQRISQNELAALVRDAAASKELIIEEDAALMQLGPLVEPQAEDGSRRFHVGDILSITTGKLTSPRGMDGIYDILGYMTDDSPFTTQLSRFAEECKPYLERQLGDAIKLEVPETVKDSLSLYKWLHTVTESMDGNAFLKVGKVSEKDHANMDVMTELELDHGPEIMKKVIKLDPNLVERDDDEQ